MDGSKLERKQRKPALGPFGDNAGSIPAKNGVSNDREMEENENDDENSELLHLMLRSYHLGGNSKDAPEINIEKYGIVHERRRL